MAKLKTGRHTSALKAHRKSVKLQRENRGRRILMNKAIKTLRSTVVSKDAAAAQKLLPKTVSAIDRAAKKGVIHSNSARRQIAKVSRAVLQIQK